MKNQYEQTCNAAFIEHMGITVLPELKNQSNRINEWLSNEQTLHINYPDHTLDILKKVIFSA